MGMMWLNVDWKIMSTHFKILSEQKVLRDPVHGYIHVHHQIIWDLLNAPEFQRLRRIHQLGGTHMVYHAAEHSRFSHSLGVYEIVRTMIDNVNGLSESLSEFEMIALMCAGLLHDVGHGPFSHSFESVTKTHHETFTDRIILENTTINSILKAVDGSLPQVVADIIAHRHPRQLLTQIISSQLDADRMDYLLRDSYFTGVSYGEFDMGRILRTMKVVNDRIVIKESGIHAVEDYIMARYQMYWQVYLHPTSRSFEVILHSLFSRMRDVAQEKPELLQEVSFFIPFVSGDQIALQAHFELDEATCQYGFMKLSKSLDPILKDLANRLMNRHLFKYDDLKTTVQLDDVKKSIEAMGFDARYYVVEDFITQTLYQKPYQHSKEDGIYVTTHDGLLELSEASEIVRGFVGGLDKEDRKVFYPLEESYE